MFGWLHRNRNRRSGERQFVLDVKLRTRQMRVARWRAAGVGLAVVASLALFALLFWRGGQWLLADAVYENPAFAIQRVEVRTDGVIAPAVIRRWAMVRPGRNLLSLDLMRIKRDLEMYSPIAGVSVERVLPGTLRIIVAERQPMAQAITLQPRRGGGFNALTNDFDETGVVMQPLDAAWRLTPAPTNALLPTLTGVPPKDLNPGHAAESPQVLAALRLLTALDRSPMAGIVELQSINVASPEILEATTSQGARITFSLDQFDVQLRRWREIYNYGQAGGKAIAWLDLSISNHLPVRWVAGNALPPLLNQFVKPNKLKRKNV
ncbi:MAG: FtsQ-type POTRA domain-containing protein [Verrucomicrobiota bacterium]|jgi:cell division septal protein FtsQ